MLHRIRTLLFAHTHSPIMDHGEKVNMAIQADAEQEAEIIQNVMFLAILIIMDPGKKANMAVISHNAKDVGARILNAAGNIVPHIVARTVELQIINIAHHTAVHKQETVTHVGYKMKHIAVPISHTEITV